MVHFRDTDPRPHPDVSETDLSKAHPDSVLGRAISRAEYERVERQREELEHYVGEMARNYRPPREPVTLWMSAELAERLEPEARRAGWRRMMRDAGLEIGVYLPIPVRDEMRDLIGIEFHPLS